MPPVPVPSRHPIASQAPKPSKHFSWRSQARPLIVVVALLIANAGLDIAKAGFFDELLGAGEPMERNYQQGPRRFRPARQFRGEYPHYRMSSEPRWPRAAQWAEARGLRHRFAHSERMGERRLSAETGQRAPWARPVQSRRLLLHRPPARRRRRPCRRAAA